MRTFQLVALFLTFRQSLGQWGGCIDISNPDALVNRKKSTEVCFTTGPDGDWGMGVEYNRYSFRPNADTYSRFTIPNSYSQLIQSSNGDDITVFASSQTSLSFLRKYYDQSYGVFPHLTAIIDVKDGVVQGIAWDDACVFCSDDLCEENTFNFNGKQASLNEPTKGCYLTRDVCDKIHGNNGDDCDLKFHVVWTGTDSNGNYLTSSNNRFSAFQPKQIQDYFKDSITQWIPSFDFGW